MIVLKNTSIGYNLPLLHVDHIELNKGKVYALVGKNGSGKSTLLKTITGQIPILKGDILIDDQSIITYHFKDIPKKIAFVPSSFPIMDYMRVDAYVSLGRSPYTGNFGLLSPEDRLAVKNALELLNIQELSRRFTTELSDGEKQLVAIAKAIAQGTDCIILDEPTSFLDYSNKTLVLNLLNRVASELNKCIILSSHDLDLCIEHACSFVVISKAKKIEFLPTPVQKRTIIEVAF